jgi:hypothetical protein
MCDYSLAHFRSRLAVEGEPLVVRRFPSGSRGLASLDPGLKELVFPYSATAVCVSPGARLVLRDIPKSLQQLLGVGEVEEVTFVQQGAEAFPYRDAVRFSNGRETLLQHLHSGQRVEVLNVNWPETEPKRPASMAA